MRFTDNFAIPCLDETDYAGLALYMQCLAEKVEAEYSALEQRRNFAFNRPTGLWVRATNLVLGSTLNEGGETLPNVFWNGSNATGGGLGTPASPYFFNLPAYQGVVHTGLYQIGAMMTTGDPTGITPALTMTVTARSRLQFPTDPHPLGGVVAEYTDREIDNNTGSMRVLSAAPLLARYPDTVLMFQANIGVGGTATANPLRLWVTYIGSNDQIEVL